MTGSNGLIGSEAVEYFDRHGHEVVGTDNDMRAFLFGAAGSTQWNLERLKTCTRNFTPLSIDIRDRVAVLDLLRAHRFDVVIHCAAQPSHEKASEVALLDFEVNALGTINLLEATRKRCPEAVFIHMSTNKVYGDAPNEKPLFETATRYDYSDPEDYNGINESCRIDRATHSLFGASKLAGDIYAQEYGRYFRMPIGIFRGSCLTGPAHSGVELHGFLAYLVKTAVSRNRYTVYGYNGKQVRDNLHSFDVVRAFEEFALNPRSGEVYNLGGGRANSVSVREAISHIDELTGKKLEWNYSSQARTADHICYISDTAKFHSHYPNWNVTRPLDSILQEMVISKWKHIQR